MLSIVSSPSFLVLFYGAEYESPQEGHQCPCAKYRASCLLTFSLRGLTSDLVSQSSDFNSGVCLLAQSQGGYLPKLEANVELRNI